jgi:hypothetical protein
MVADCGFEHREALARENRVDAACIVVDAAAFEIPAPGEPIDDPCDAAARVYEPLGELGHPELVVGRAEELVQHLEAGEVQSMPCPELVVERADDTRVCDYE